MGEKTSEETHPPPASLELGTVPEAGLFFKAATLTVGLALEGLGYFSGRRVPDLEASRAHPIHQMASCCRARQRTTGKRVMRKRGGEEGGKRGYRHAPHPSPF